MRRTVLIILVLFMVISGVSADRLEYSIGVDWQLSAQVGVLAPLSDRISLQAALGVSAMGLVAAEAYVTCRLPLFDPPWGAHILFGIPNFLVVPTLEGAMLSLGGAFAIKRRFSDKISFHLRLGAGYPFFIEEDRPVLRDITFPLNLWPEAALVMYYRPAP